MYLQSASNLLNRYRGSDTNLYQRNLEAQALMAQQQALGMGIQGLSSQTALDLLQVSLYASPDLSQQHKPLPFLKSCARVFCGRRCHSLTISGRLTLDALFCPVFLRQSSNSRLF